MATPGGFSSFPDRPEVAAAVAIGIPEAGPSMPSFSSFPMKPDAREADHRVQSERRGLASGYREERGTGKGKDAEYRSTRDDKSRRRRSRSREQDQPRDRPSSRDRDRRDTHHRDVRDQRSRRTKYHEEAERKRERHRRSQYDDISDADHKRRKRDRDGHRMREHEEKLRDHRERDDDRRDTKPHHDLPTRPPEPAEWFIDTSGDPDVLRYGSIDPRKIVQHNVFGYGTVVGLPENQRIGKVAERDRGGYGSGVVVEVRGPGGRAPNANYQQQSEQRELGTSSAYQRAQVANKAMEQNKLALADPVKFVVPPRGAESRAMTRQADFIGVSSSVAGTGDRLSIEAIRSSGGNQVSSESDEEDSDMETNKEQPANAEGASAEPETPEEALRRRTKEFEIRLARDPADVHGWIAYSTLQLSRPDKVFSKQATSDVDGARRGETEVAMSILDKAFQRHPNNEISIVMQRAYLKLAQNIWPVSKVTQRYQGVLKMLEEKAESADEGQRMDFWLEYIEWREGRGLGSVESGATGGKATGDSGGVDDLVTVYVECMQTMQQSMRDHPSRQEEIEANLVYLQLRLVSLLRQSGYEERATAILQAMLELTFFKPDALRRAHTTGRALHTWQDVLLNSLEEFWESEVPRIGEDVATGWRAWESGVDRDGSSQTVEPVESTKSLVAETGNNFDSWYAAEVRAAKEGSMPARATDLNLDEEDPFRVVLFSDIQDCIFVIQSGDVKLQLVYAALAYLGLAVQPAETGSNAKLAIDPHMATDISPAITTFWPASAESTGFTGRNVSGNKVAVGSAPFGCPVMCWLTDANSSFRDRDVWFSSPTMPQILAVDAKFCRNFFHQLRTIVKDQTFRSAQLAFESALCAKTSGKVAKKLLVDDQSNLQLYADYARILRAHGTLAKEIESINVYCQALRGSVDVDSERQQDRDRLFADFAELEWIRGRGRRCLAILCSASSQLDVDALACLANVEHEGPHLSVTCILQTGKHYRSLPSTSPGSTLFMTTLFEYYGANMGQPTDDSISSALSHLTHIITGQVDSSSPLCEAAYQLGSRIMHLHRKQQAFMAGGESRLSEWLEQAVRAFPNNTTFLGLLLAMEAGAGSGSGRIFGKLQRVLNEVVLVEGEADRTKVGAEQHVVGPRTWAWAAWAEAQLVGAEGFWSSRTGEGVGIGAAGLERVRKVLEMAVSSIAGKHCLPLWLLYIDFEISQNRAKTAKTLCYRAVARLGGCKDLYMLAFSPAFRDHFTPQELNSWADLMLERGIRVRVPTERYWTSADVEQMGMFDRLDDDMLEIEAGEDDPYAKIREERAALPM